MIPKYKKTQDAIKTRIYQWLLEIGMTSREASVEIIGKGPGYLQSNLSPDRLIGEKAFKQMAQHIDFSKAIHEAVRREEQERLDLRGQRISEGHARHPAHLTVKAFRKRCPVLHQPWR